MYRSILVIAFVGIFTITEFALATPIAPYQEARAEYDPATGNIQVSVNSVVNWYLEFLGSNVMTGDTPSGLPGGGGFITDHSKRIGESALVPMTYDVNLGRVAVAGLPDDGSLQIFWNGYIGNSVSSSLVEFSSHSSANLPPQANINGPFLIDLLNDPLNLTLDASGSTDDGVLGPLNYRWDLDNDGIFEVDSGTNPILEIPDVSTTFGGHGVYPVDVQVSDGEFWDIAPTTVSLFSEPIVPASAQYDPATGQIVASVYGVTNWYIESMSGGLRGDEPTGLPGAGGYVLNHHIRIGESRMSELFSYTVDLGNVALPGLPEDELTIFWSDGISYGSMPLIYGAIASSIESTVPEPSGLILGLFAMLGLGHRRFKKLAL